MKNDLNKLLEEFKKNNKNKDNIRAITNEISMQNQSGEKVQDGEKWKRFMLEVLDNCYNEKNHECLVKKIIDFSKSFSSRSANNEGNKTIHFEVIGKCLNKKLDIDDVDKIDYLEYAIKSEQIENALTLLVNDLGKNEKSSDLLCKYVDKIIEHDAEKAGKKLFDKLNKRDWDFTKSFVFFHPLKVNRVMKFSNNLVMGLNSKNFKQGLFIHVVIILAAIGLGIGITSIVRNQIDKDTISILVNNETQIIEHTYGTELDLSDVVISYEKNKHDGINFIGASFDMISNYNPEIIGSQTITLTFHNSTKEIEVYTLPADLAVPTLSLDVQSKSLVWTQVQHAGAYELLYSTNQIDFNLLTTTNDTTYDLSSFIDLYDPTTYDFTVKAIKESEKYSDSEISSCISVKIIDKVDNIAYVDGLLTWEGVTDASFYNIDIDGHIHENITSTQMNIPLDVGAHSITIHSYSKEQNSISSVSNIYQFDIKQLNKVEYSLKNGILYWNEIKDAETYDVYINNKLYESTTATYVDLSSFAADVYKVSIISKNTQTNYFDSKKNEQYHLINLKLNVLDDVVSWPTIVGNYKYVLYVDNVAVNNASFNTSFDLSTIDLSSGNHTLYVEVLGDVEIKNNKSSNIIVNKLAAPEIYIENAEIKYSSPSNIKFYANGKEFGGNINELKDAGKYEIYAVSTIKNSNDISSNKSNVLTITRNQAPEIYIKNGTILSKDSTSDIIYYLNGLEFYGDLSDLDCGTYSITAIHKGDGVSTFDSKASNILIVTKLDTPILQYQDNVVVCTNESPNTVYVLDGKDINAIDFDYNHIPDGIHTITTYNKNLNENEIHSNYSNEIKFLKTTIQEKISKHSTLQNAINIAVTPSYFDSEKCKFEIHAIFLKDGAQIDEQTYSSGSFNQVISYHRGNIDADEIIFQIIIKGDFETYCKTFSKKIEEITS